MLTEEQIQQLFSFCKKHFVHHYDVQAELVDHLANAIEEKMDANKNLSFEQALSNAYAGFGIMGFAGIINDRSQMLVKQYGKLRKQIFFSYFTWPKAAMTACLFLFLSFLRLLLTGPQLFYFLSILLLCLLGFQLIVFIQAKRLWKQQRQKLLMTEAGREQSFFNYLVGIQILFHFYNYNDFISKYHQIFFTSYYIIIIIMILLFISILAYKALTKKINELARNQYPEAFMGVSKLRKYTY